MLEKNKIYNMLCLEGMKQLNNKSIDCIITSPPYYNMRDYNFSEQWGLENTFEEYLEHLWLFMDEAYRVLKDEGTIWINLGDSYGTKSGGMASAQDDFKSKESKYKAYKKPLIQNKPKNLHKCLMLIPSRFAIGCISSNTNHKQWILRNDIIWASRNKLCESVKDRFSKKYEHIFFFVKKAKGYYFDLDSIREECITKEHRPHGIIRNREYEYQGKYSIENKFQYSVINSKYRKKIIEYRNLSNQKEILKKSGLKQNISLGKNPGDVADFWDINTKPSNEKHYASYNLELIIKPILAGCPENGIILDPFMGIGTTAIACIKYNRNFIGFDGNLEYCNIANKRINIELEKNRIF